MESNASPRLLAILGCDFLGGQREAVPMSTSHFFTEMERQYAVLLGRYQVAEHATETIVGLKALTEADARISKERRGLQQKMDRIVVQIQGQCDPDWTPDHIRPVVERTQNDRRGEISKAAYKVLKGAPRPLKTREIAHAVAPLLGLVEPDEREMARIDVAIYTAMKRRLKEGMVVCEGKPIQWSIKRQTWRPRASAAYASSPSTNPRPASALQPDPAPRGTADRC